MYKFEKGDEMNDDLEKDIAGCGCAALVLICNFFIGGWSVGYLLSAFLSKTIPFWGSCLIGLFTAEFSVPVACVVWLLRAFHVF